MARPSSYLRATCAKGLAMYTLRQRESYLTRLSFKPKLPLLIDHTKMKVIITHFVTLFETVMSLLTSTNHDL
jgi:hypothetical protein